jgi:hypothetical protein
MDSGVRGIWGSAKINREIQILGLRQLLQDEHLDLR